jgi:hypothetical protein
MLFERQLELVGIEDFPPAPTVHIANDTRPLGIGSKVLVSTARDPLKTRMVGALEQVDDKQWLSARPQWERQGSWPRSRHRVPLSLRPCATAAAPAFAQ